MQFGDILCLKTTGELVFVLTTYDNLKTADVRRPTMERDGIFHKVDTFFQAELETPEEHLRREAKDMILKGDIQNEVLEAREAQEVNKKTDISVN
jgi:hypothetical protein